MALVLLEKLLMTTTVHHSIIICGILIAGQWVAFLLLGHGSLPRTIVWTILPMIAVACHFMNVRWTKMVFLGLGGLAVAPLLLVGLAYIFLNASINNIAGLPWILITLNAICGVCLIVIAQRLGSSRSDCV
jgi:hypothetical protein